MITGIVVALPDELSSLTEQKLDKGTCLFLSSHLWVALSGAGPNNAQRSAEQLLDRGVRRLISWGCAAGLKESMRPGDITLPNCIVDANGNVIQVSTSWHSHAARLLQGASGLPIKIGTLIESKCLIAESSEKIRVHSETGAIALDMESAAIAKVAQRQKADFIAIRAVADPVTMSLPNSVSQALTDQGDIQLDKLFRSLARRPWEIPSLIQLGRNFHRAKKALTQVSALLDELTSLPK